MSDDLNWLSATALIKAYRKKKISPVDVVRACLAQIAKHDKAINAMCFVDEPAALASAKASEKRWHKGEPIGAGDGVPAL
ncbi:MAG: amidase, partial [Parvibaculaceae bacterium]